MARAINVIARYLPELQSVFEKRFAMKHAVVVLCI
jgi:hypothetical protein